MLGLATAGGKSARAANESITLVNYGGDAIKAYAEYWGKPFTQATGITVNIDGSGPLLGRIRKMVDDKAVVWDIGDLAPYYGVRLGSDYFVPIDYSIVARDKSFPWLMSDYCAGSYCYSNVLAYDSSKFPSDPPKTWVDFFDRKKYPGKRALFKWGDGSPEACMLGAGKALNEVFPLDMDLVAKMVKSLGDDLVLWDSGGMSQQLFLDGEIVMGMLWNTRARQLERDTKGRVKYTWNQQIVAPAGWSILKGSKHVAAAQKFIASTQNPASQIGLLDALGNGPASLEAVKMLTPEQAKSNPTSHLEVGVLQSAEYYAKHYDEMVDNWTDAISG